jgi:hypothetical protein
LRPVADARRRDRRERGTVRAVLGPCCRGERGEDAEYNKQQAKYSVQRRPLLPLLKKNCLRVFGKRRKLRCNDP